MNIDAELLTDAAEVVNDMTNEEVFARSYSGRGMYGKQCFAIEFDEASDLVLLGAAIAYCAINAANEEEGVLEAADLVDSLMGALPKSRFDSMGTEY